MPEDSMRAMAMNCSWADAQLKDDPSLVASLPVELRALICTTSGPQYLEAVASATLLPAATDKLSALYRLLLPEITARWLRKIDVSPFADHVHVLSSLAKILPFAPYLKPRVKEAICRSQELSSLANANTTLSGLDNEQLHNILLAFFRLFTYDPVGFKPFVHPAVLSTFLKHKLLPVRYLAIQCLSQSMCFADALSQSLLTKYIGRRPIQGTWEGKTIDFRVLKLLEEQRWKQYGTLLSSLALQSSNTLAAQHSSLVPNNLLPETANLGGILIPRTIDESPDKPSLVPTPTSVRALGQIGIALLGTKSILLIGEPGSGKTSLVLEAARELRKFSSMITLHLNEQTDAKSLLGLYTSSKESDSFIWQPGVLTQAITEGRWILIEDIDEAPADVLGVIRPILQDRELYLPARKETLRAADGFRIFATMKTAGRLPSSAAGVRRNQSILDDSCWSVIEVETPNHTEIHDIIIDKFPALQLLIPSMLDVHERIELEFRNNQALKSTTARSPSLRELLKWCRRTLARLDKSDAMSGTSINEASKFDIFRDAVDCYAGHLSANHAWLSVAHYIAEKMHIAPQEVHHSLKADLPKITETKLSIRIGRAIMPKLASTLQKQKKLGPFAFTREACMMLGKIAAATSQSEPLLLVGETGVGKTTLVQHISGLLGQSLTVVNLSQQSEVSDLLGGLKPVTTRSLMVPVVDQFNDLFDKTFSAKRNEKFLSSIKRYVGRENWQRVLILWKQAVQMAENSLRITIEDENANETPRIAKRRKLDNPEYEGLRERWAAFSQTLGQLHVQVDHAERRLTFAYIEGRIVRAVREGAWLLLDEINLASSDTLDSIATLVGDIDQGRPYLHLTEAGKPERVEAHPDFRIFAAMNPATDTGKKDLAPGIRSRFTEIYVHSGDSDMHDLINLIETYLGGLLESDKRMAFDLASLYLAVKELNQEHRIEDGAGDDPHFTIRSLVRCLLYIQKHAAAYGLRRAVFEGANMSFCTMLSRQSERMVMPLIDKHIFSCIKNVRALLSQSPRMPADGVRYVSFQHHLVMQGKADPSVQPDYIRTPSVERNLLNLARAASMHRFPILLQGPTSSGKTSMVEYLAKSTGNQFVRVNNHEHTDLQEYLGSYASGNDGRLEFREGVLVEALRKGHWIVLDELNLAPSDVLEALNRLLDDNRQLLIPETQEVVRPHESFMLFATQNPAGLYGGRKRLSRAFRNRFLELHFDDIPEDELEIILQKRSHIAPSFCTQIVAVYKKLSLQRQSSRLFEHQNSFATLRDLFRWASRPMADRTQLATQGFMLLGERVREPAERQIVKNIIEEVIRVRIDLASLYSDDQVPASLRNGTVVWTPAMQRLFVLVSEALNNNEPVLLVGETGCGKTQICQTVAEAFKSNLNIYNAHINTETGDLIGSQRPVRHNADADHQLRRQLLAVLEPVSPELDPEGEPLESLVKKFDLLKTSTVDEHTVASISANIARYKSLFEWVDGSLVRTMKNGQHFLLDEISLAEDSVLERLNSLLEPSRTILLAEKGPTENVVVGAPGFQFLSTMNPGGDYGKRELSAALRNRLTEVWVPPLAQAEDVLPIIESKLVLDLRPYAGVMIDFSGWFRSHFMSTDAGGIPLRDLITWAKFLQHSNQLNAVTALYHGAAMVFIDSLGANPAGIMSSVIGDIKQARALCTEKLNELTGSNLPSIYHEDLTLVLTKTHLRVGHFQIENGPKSKQSLELIADAPTTLKNMMRIVRALQMERPILLEGSPGVGKTAIVTALAQVVGKNLTRINLSDQTDLMDLFGADIPVENEGVGKFAWSDGPLLQAMQAGGWVLLDEMNLASQAVLEGLNSCLDHRQEVFIAELGRTFACHPEFKLFAAQNPHHQGGGRKGLPKSFVNRFTVVYADPFEHDDLYRICSAKFPSIQTPHLRAIVDTICQMQILSESDLQMGAGGPWEFNLRDVTRWLQMLEKTPSLQPHHYFGPLISQRLRNSYQRDVATSVCNDILGLAVESSLYHSLSPGLFQVGTSFLPRDKSWQRTHLDRQSMPTAMLAHAQSMIEAVNRRWPVIISGSAPASGMALVRHLAAIAGASLTRFALNADTDTMDLIGGIEQRDPRQDLLTFQKILQNALEEDCLLCLRHDDFVGLAALLRLKTSSVAPGNDLQDLQKHLKVLPKSFNNVQHVQDKLQDFLSKPKHGRGGFVWKDGVLVDALMEGHWLVLENANTCNPAVLDRLNSLLEPGGVLTLGEQHNFEGPPRVIEPHPEFRIFLTTDTRYGEVSRAMRNRSLELYVDESASNNTNDGILGYPCASDAYRFRHVEIINDADLAMQPLLASTWVDRFSERDLHLLEHHNIHNSSPWDETLLQSQLTARRWLRPGFAAQGTALQSQLLVQAQLEGSNLFQYLPMPAVNEPLVALSSDLSMKSSIENFAWAQKLLLRINDILRNVDEATENSQMLQRNEQNLLEMSLVRNVRSDAGKLPFANFLVNALSALREVIEHNNIIDKIAIRFIENVLAFVNDVHTLSRKGSIESGIVSAYLQNGYEMLNTSPVQLESLHVSLCNALDLFTQDFELDSGRSLHIMWDNLRPWTASSDQQLRDLMKLETLIERVDRLSIPPSSLSHVVKVKKQLVDSYQSTLMNYAKDTIPFDQIDSQLLKLSAVAEGVETDSSSLTGAFQSVLQLATASARLSSIELISSFAKTPTSLEKVTSGNRQLPQAFAAVLQMTQSSTHAEKRWDAWRDCFGIALIQKLTRNETQPISSMDRSAIELKTLLQSISAIGLAFSGTTILQRLQAELRHIVHGICLSHSHFLSPESVACLAREDLSSIKLSFPASLPQDHYFRTIYRDYLENSISWLGIPATTSSVHLLGASYVAVSLGLLRLVVPNRPVDPALTSQVAYTQFDRRMQDITMTLRAQREFENEFTGQKTNILIRMTEEELQRIGDEPRIAAVVRPPASGLDLLAVEFKNILKLIIDRQPEKILLSRVQGRWQEQKPSKENLRLATENLLQIIDQISQRLKSVDRAYDDLTKPVIWALSCLSLGTQMVAACHSNPTQATGRIQVQAIRIPWLNATAEQVMNSPSPGSSSKAMEIQSGFEWLEHFALGASVEEDGLVARPGKIAELVVVTDKIYETWKARLEKDQDAAIARSRYYAYRGDEDLDESQEKEAIAQIFPMFDETQETGVKSSEPSLVHDNYDARAIAVRTAKLQQQVLFKDEEHTELLEAYICSSLGHLSEDFPFDDCELGPVSSQTLVPAILLHLDRRLSTLEATERQPKLNIYADGDVVEARKLYDLVRVVVDNFQRIHITWPEHALPAEVLTCCREILKFNFNDPIAKLLTKTEKLLDLVSQWQVVASKEYSADENVDDLTRLIIRWRQLELGSWSRLLNLEQQKVEEHALSWYFILYEAIILNPRHVLDRQGDLPAYLTELALTLEDFLTSTTIGELSPRLQLCLSFNQLLNSMTIADPLLRGVLDCVTNTIHRHERYKRSAESTLANGRAELEKNLEEQIKLASWKDTNVSALRESARRSHHKLFKIIRKYRTLLSQPLQLSSRAVSVERDDISNLVMRIGNVQTPVAAVDAALLITAENVSHWTKRPERLRNPFGAAARMKLLMQRPIDDFTAWDELSNFTSSLQRSMKDLKSRTPTTLTEENQSLVSHLKGLKQTLFSDTLRTVKRMGVRRDLGSIEMDKQRSCATVLAHVPSLKSQKNPLICTRADSDFLEVLDLMPIVRHALTQHSEQVRVADMRRSVSYVEGLLAVLIQQRQDIAVSEHEVNAFAAVLNKLRAFGQHPVPHFKHAPSDFQSKRRSLTTRLCWLPEILSISAKVLRIQMQHSEYQLSHVIDALLVYRLKIKHSLSQLRPEVPLIASICLKSEVSLTESISDLLSQLQRFVEREMEAHPPSANILQNLIPWTNLTTIEIETAANGFYQDSINELDYDISICLDVTFEAVQHVSVFEDQIPKSSETSGWFTKTNVRQSEMMQMLQVLEVTEKLGHVETKLAHVSMEKLLAGISLVIAVLPILEQYLLICENIVDRSLAIHSETARMTEVLARTLTVIAADGFCSPEEATKGEESLGPVESGTGLGDGTGAEDISKDVGDDEDLSELAQADNEKPEGEDLQASKDAVNMDRDNLNGDDGSVEENTDEEAGSQSSDEGASDLDEETGSVDNLDASAVDEKIWDGLDASKDKQLEDEKANGENSDKQIAKQEKQASGTDHQERIGEEVENDDEQSASGSDDEDHDAVDRDENIAADPNVREEKALDLPDELQLNGEEKADLGETSDDEMANLSDRDEDFHSEAPEEAQTENSDLVEDSTAGNGVEDAADELEAEGETGQADEDEIIEDQPELGMTNDEKNHDSRQDEIAYDIDENQAGEIGEGRAVDDEQDLAKVSHKKSVNRQNDNSRQQPQDDMNVNEQEEGTDETGGVTRGGRSEMDIASQQAEALKKLGDILEQWHQRREIHQATQDNSEPAPDDIDMADADFEHIQNEADLGDTQALGAASKDQAQALDQSKGIEDDNMRADLEQDPTNVSEQELAVREYIVEEFSQLQEKSDMESDSGPGAIIPEHKHQFEDVERQSGMENDLEDDRLDTDVIDEHFGLTARDPLMSQAEASQVWAHYSAKVQHMSLLLTEQLRLILAPTLATKLRGDFRTGKRLNIKRIIPYIASGYKRDKIWMRRSVPSKRNYQVMLALDDSKSMMEGGAGALAFETLAMLCKSLSMLEVGDLCVVGFGNEEHIHVAHPFGQPFGNEAGVKIFQNFTFNQTATDVRKMVKESIDLFQDARAKSTGIQSELWQLQLIISDGICEDHETVSRLVRQAKEEKIMIVFVIVDGSGQSILDLTQASFEPDETGEMKLSMRRYLEKFPFPYYLVVRDVRDLPAALATALKGWFAQVVDVHR